MAGSHRRAFLFESLESRILLATDLAFSVVINDPLGVATPFHSAITSHIQAAGAEWDAYLEGRANLEVVVEFSTTSTPRATGRSLTTNFVHTHGAFNVFEQGAAAEIRTGIDPNGALPDIELTFNPGYLANELWFDPNPSLRTAPVPVNRTDAMTVVMHELGHALAFNGFLDPVTGAHTGPFESTFDEWVVRDGTGFFFTGPSAMSLYGSRVPLTFTTYPHVGNEAPRPGSDLLSDLMNGVVFFRGDRYDISALDLAMVADTGLPVNDAPVLTPIGNRSVNEGTTLTFVIAATDAETPAAQLTFSAAGLPPGATFNPATRRFTWTPTEAQGAGVFDVTFSASDSDLTDEEIVRITVGEVNLPPVLAAIGNKTVDAGQDLTFTASATDPDTPANGLIFSLDPDAPAGATINPSTGVFHWAPTHAQAPGLFPVTVRVTDTGTPALADTETITVRVNEIALTVLEFEPTADGFRLLFNRPLDPGTLNLYDTETGGLGAADLTLVGDVTGAVRGSLVVSADARTVTFIQTGGPLASDVYRLTLRSAANGFRDDEGGLLDGNGDGVGGDNLITAFPVFPAPLRLSLADFSRGPGQPVDVPATNGGLPIQLSNGLGVQSVDFTLAYDPALLTLSGATLGATLPPGGVLSANLIAPGLAHITVTLPAPLAAGAVELVRLTGLVPATAPYKAAHVLDIANVLVNAGDLAADGGDGLHVVAYIGDATGNGGYSSLDGQRVLRVVTGMDGGFSAFPLIDPVVVGDTTGNGALSSLDASRVLQEVVGLDRPEIPPIPPGITLAASVPPSGPPAPSVPASATPPAPSVLSAPASRGFVTGLVLSAPRSGSGIAALLDLDGGDRLPSAPTADTLDSPVVLPAPAPPPAKAWASDFVNGGLLPDLG
jgi:hypothetical protein